MTVELAVRACGLPECGGVEVEYAHPERGCKRRPPAALLVLAVRAGQPGAGLCGIPGQQNVSPTPRSAGMPRH